MNEKEKKFWKTFLLCGVFFIVGIVANGIFVEIMHETFTDDELWDEQEKFFSMGWDEGCYYGCFLFAYHENSKNWSWDIEEQEFGIGKSYRECEGRCR